MIQGRRRKGQVVDLGGETRWELSLYIKEAAEKGEFLEHWSSWASYQGGMEGLGGLNKWVAVKGGFRKR